MAAKLFDDKCPKCKSPDLDYDAMEPIEQEMTQRVTCNKCNYEFTIYSLLNWVWNDEQDN